MFLKKKNTATQNPDKPSSGGGKKVKVPDISKAIKKGGADGSANGSFGSGERNPFDSCWC